MKLRYLSNSTLLAEFKRVVARERWAIASVIEYIVEIDRRQLYLDAACSSMTGFCIERMGYSQDAAANRVGVARVVQQYPVALAMLRRGELTMTNIRTVAPVLTKANHRERFAAIVGKTKLEVQELVAFWAPKPDVQTRLVDITPPSPPDLLLCMQAATTSHAEQVPVTPQRPAPLPKPLSPGRFKVEFTADEEERELLMRARDLLRHSIPDGDIKKIFMKGLRELVERAEARKLGKLKKAKVVANEELPLEGEAAAEEVVTTARSATRAMRREISERDGVQCAYCAKDGTRCKATAWLEADHMDGYAKTGKTQASRMRWLCRSHNQGRNKGHDDLARPKTFELPFSAARSGTSAPEAIPGAGP